MLIKRYREFIQSSDAISFMAEKASFTHTALRDFWPHSQALVAKVQEVYSIANKLRSQGRAMDDVNSFSSEERKIFLSSVTSFTLWDCLSECNVFDAAAVQITFLFY